MPQTFTRLHYHIVFSTKHREPTITPDLRQRLWEYIGGIVRGESGIPIQIGGTADHVHVLVTLRQDLKLSDFVRTVKAGASGWAHDTFPNSGMWWQAGYGAFTVSHSAVDDVTRYIANQEEHHRSRTFQDEFRDLLTKHGIEFDEKYLWD